MKKHTRKPSAKTFIRLLLNRACLFYFSFHMLSAQDFESLLHKEQRHYKIRTTTKENGQKDELDLLFQVSSTNKEPDKEPLFVKFKPGMQPGKTESGFIHFELLLIFHPHKLSGLKTPENELIREIKDEIRLLQKELKLNMIFDESFMLKSCHIAPFATYNSLNAKRRPLTAELLKRLFRKHQTPAEQQTKILALLQKEIFELE